MARPLFIPLRKRWFEAFRDGAKAEEWRRYGPRWNERTCWVGRPVLLSLGYTRTRLAGTVASFRTRPADAAAAGLYGEGTRCAVIGVELDRGRPPGLTAGATGPARGASHGVAGNAPIVWTEYTAARAETAVRTLPPATFEAHAHRGFSALHHALDGR